MNGQAKGRSMQKFRDRKFVEAVELLQQADGKKARRDKRRSTRHEIRVPVQIKSGDEDQKSPWTTVKLRDISPRGVLLEISQKMEAGSSLLLRLPAEVTENPASPLICRVCHCRKDSGEVFLIGVEFIGRMNTTPTSATSDAERDRIQRSILL